MNILRRWQLPLIIILAVTAFVTTSAFRSKSSYASSVEADTQDLTSLERRISLLEQRFYGVENSITRLEQQSRLNSGTQMPTSNDRTLEINLLRSQIEMLQRRVTEIECGLTKLDERTLNAATREARKRANAINAADPCRLNAEAPLKLSTRP